MVWIASSHMYLGRVEATDTISAMAMLKETRRTFNCSTKRSSCSSICALSESETHCDGTNNEWQSVLCGKIVLFSTVHHIGIVFDSASGMPIRPLVCQMSILRA
jgi:hypothetical protein